ncbi:ROK family protein [Arthrobacter sp. zg-Y20]|uniref:ROK family protein n=1 Tax=unclassified Arthrobacter TaxID=235627 RepID=UPI001D14D556|nr:MULTISPECIES: ROK family protein [unclassified Arthrobacter]MCC3276235.1 ROK family protein [Arthrobacter sp. zg-Y20]MDK1316395.1 ROK family protein [Arthrobacter sp. zg.Y20]WIB06442.1 ROK family protein [Arthrobacter sp. zg-Y20]
MPHVMATGSGVALNLIRSGRATSRRSLRDELGWSRITLERRLKELLESSIIISVGPSDSQGGRPPEEFAVNPSAGLLLAMDIGGSHTRLAITDLTSNVLSEDEADIGPSQGPDDIFDWAGQVFDHMLARLGKTHQDVVGVGVGVPGPVDRETGRLGTPQVDAQWEGVLVQEFFAKRYAHAIFAVDRDVNILALAEARRGWREYTDVVVVKAGIGLGSAFVLNGSIYHGYRGGAGDLSYPPKRAGRLQRLEEVASGGVIREELRSRGYKVRTSKDIVNLARVGDREVLRLLSETGSVIGEALADVVGLLNPQAVVVGGNLAEAGEAFLASIREAIFAGARDYALAGLVVEPSRLGAIAGVTGASLIAQDALFAPDRISKLTRDAVKSD